MSAPAGDTGGRMWLAGCAPHAAGGPRPDGHWPIQVGHACDLVSVPRLLGERMAARLGALAIPTPVAWTTTEDEVVWALERGEAAHLPPHLERVKALAAGALAVPHPAGTLVWAPPPGAAGWLMPPRQLSPPLLCAGEFAELLALAAAGTPIPGAGARPGGIVSQAGLAWLAAAAPHAAEPQEAGCPLVEVGRVCDLAATPLQVGLEMLSQALRRGGAPPAWTSGAQVTWCLAVGAGAELASLRLAWIEPLPARHVAQAPPLGGAEAGGGASWRGWLSCPDGDPPLWSAARLVERCAEATRVLTSAACAWPSP